MREIGRRAWFGVLVMIGSLVAAPLAHATVDNWKAYKQAYPDKKAVSCKTCHEHPVGKLDDLNGYGKALQAGAEDPKKLTADEIKTAEAADPDKDGATTLQEIEAGTDPSDPASVPPATGAVSDQQPPPAPTGS